MKRNPSIPEDTTRGVINLTINYDPNAGILTVRLIEVGYLMKFVRFDVKIQFFIFAGKWFAAEGLQWHGRPVR